MGRVRRVSVLAAASAILAVACATPQDAATLAQAPPPTTQAEPSTTSPPPPQAFSATVSAVTAADLPDSWRPGCPVGPEQLRMLRLTYWTFEDTPSVGTIVIGAGQADSVIAVFRRLYDERFPIRRMEPVDVFGGDDRASMAADNTSGFNCRNAVASGPLRWSAHAYGEAIDVNPVENPYLQGGEVQPVAGSAYVDRSRYRPGMAVDGGVVTAAFAAAGWSWGGRWTATPDYQHFSATGG